MNKNFKYLLQEIEKNPMLIAIIPMYSMMIFGFLIIIITIVVVAGEACSPAQTQPNIKTENRLCKDRVLKEIEQAKLTGDFTSDQLIDIGIVGFITCDMRWPK